MARWRCCRCLTDAVRWSGVIHWNGSEEVLSWSDEKFCRELQSAFGWRLGQITHAGKRSAYPAALTRAARPITHRTVLVECGANSAPDCRARVNLGMRDVMSLAETLTQAQERGEDMGDYGVLCRYQQRRQRDREATIGVTDSLVHLFCQPVGPRWLSGATSG